MVVPICLLKKCYNYLIIHVKIQIIVITIILSDSEEFYNTQVLTYIILFFVIEQITVK